MLVSRLNEDDATDPLAEKIEYRQPPRCGPNEKVPQVGLNMLINKITQHPTDQRVEKAAKQALKAEERITKTVANAETNKTNLCQLIASVKSSTTSHPASHKRKGRPRCSREPNTKNAKTSATLTAIHQPRGNILLGRGSAGEEGCEDNVANENASTFLPTELQGDSIIATAASAAEAKYKSGCHCHYNRGI